MTASGRKIWQILWAQAHPTGWPQRTHLPVEDPMLALMGIDKYLGWAANQEDDNSPMRLFEFCLDVTPQVVLLFALIYFFWRKLFRRYPFFFSFIVFQLLDFVAAMLIYRYAVFDPPHRSQLYKRAATSGLAIGSIFEFGVLYELSDTLLLSRIRRWEGVRPCLRWTLAMLVLVASLASALLAQANLSRVLATFQTLNFSVNLIKAGFLLVMISLTRVLNISWKGLSAGIALGLGISAAADIAASALMSQLTNLTSGTVDMIRMAGFQICVLVWVAHILRGENPSDPAGNKLPPSDVEAHVRELQRMSESYNSDRHVNRSQISRTRDLIISEFEHRL